MFLDANFSDGAVLDNGYFPSRMFGEVGDRSGKLSLAAALPRARLRRRLSRLVAQIGTHFGVVLPRKNSWPKAFPLIAPRAGRLLIPPSRLIFNIAAVISRSVRLYRRYGLESPCRIRTAADRRRK